MVGIAPDTNRLDLAAIALASARGGSAGPHTAGTAVPPASPALGIPSARSALPLSGPVPVAGPRTSAHGRAPGSWRRFLGTRQALVGLTIAGAVAGAGVAVVGVASAMTGTGAPAVEAPAAQQDGASGQQGDEDSGRQGGQNSQGSQDEGAGDAGASGSGSGY